MTEHTFIRNEHSNLLINTDRKALIEHKEKKLLMAKIMQLEKRIEDLEDRLNVITKVSEC